MRYTSPKRFTERVPSQRNGSLASLWLPGKIRSSFTATGANWRESILHPQYDRAGTR